ncbi:hypothetical protein E3P92_03131 [Wallemia ichthyophaga]|nr:hypothetical protein E3P97_03030 [Wallemia ichthyophaga]TIB05726.1 hypothetical protein E3P96_00977 [Wallemia ichthyophaga]TIB10728.1 hypothetical protein E3P92_03131 [Wallemia ichthyophaga]TIB30401.1 hypothetical protein E3P85_02775 [Wallemia ichthyophaga]TIB45229.1 hypothetical protein E3P82_02956 [Wallemia ichthyophaga]
MPAELEKKLQWFNSTHNFQLRSSTNTSSETNKKSDLFSFEKFIQRLQSFSLRTYTSKPIELSPPAVALKGWHHDQAHRNRLYCDKCKNGVVVDLSAAQTSTYQKLTDTFVQAIDSSHSVHCPWKYQQCPSSMYRLQELSLPPTLAANSIAERARLIDSNVKFSIQLVHPLSDMQIDSLINAFPDPKPSKESSILALYGWEFKSTSSNHDLLLVSQLDCAKVSLRSDKAMDVVREHRFYAPQLMPLTQGSNSNGVEALFALITRRGRKKHLEESFILDTVSRQDVLKNVKGLLSGSYQS